MKTIKVFIASSEELHLERLEFTDMIQQLNKALKPRGIEIEPVKWEYLDSSMNEERKQTEYNNALKECELCLVMYWTRFGEYTEEELTTAWECLKSGNNPKKLYVYFKEPCNETKELKDFKDSFVTRYGHFYCKFENVDTLRLNFLLQFEQYQNAILSSASIIEMGNSKLEIDGKEYVDLKNVPFVGNNEEYNELLKSIKRTQKLLNITDEDDPEYKEYAEELEQLKEKQRKKEKSIWETALLITKFSTSKCSERLSRAIELFNSGDDKGANAVLKEEEIDSDIERNIKLIELGEEGRKGLIINIDEYRLKIKVLHCSLHKEDYEKIITFRKKVIDLCVRIYGECSINVAEEYHELAKEYELLDNYTEAQKNYENSIEIQKALELTDTLYYADTLRGLGKLHVTNEMYLKGKPYLEQALTIIGDKFGAKNLTYVKSLRDLSVFYRNMDFYDEAIESASKALDIAESLHNFDKSLYNSIKRDLAIAYAVREKKIVYDDHFTTEKDKNDFIKAVNLLKEVYDSEIEDKKACINNLYLIGKVLEKNHGWPLKGDPKLIEAADYYTKALKIAKEIDGKKYISELLKRIGKVYKELETPEKAEALGYSYPIAETKDNKTLSEAFIEYREKQEKSDLEVARTIANLYLDKFPRNQSFGITLSSTEDDSELTFYHELSIEEIDVLRKCSTIAFEEDCTIDEILSEEGHDELAERLVDHGTPLPLNIIDSIDFDNPLKFTRFSFQSINDDGTLGYKRRIGTPLTDDEFKEILIELLLNKNRYSMNMLVYHKPELCQKIIKHITYASMDNQFENWNSYIADMCEHKDICERILNPFKDILNIFNSEDKEISNYALRHQIVPDDDNEIYANYEETDSFHCLMNFQGTRLVFEQEGITSIKGNFHDLECFNIDAKKLMEKFSLKDPKEILPYLKEHYNTPDCFYRIKKEFEA